MKIVKVTIWKGTMDVTDVPTGVEFHEKLYLDEMTEPNEDDTVQKDAIGEYVVHKYTAGEDEIVYREPVEPNEEGTP